jgi:hypothetical protein
MMAAGCQKRRGGVEGGAAGEADERASACMHHFGLKRVQRFDTATSTTGNLEAKIRPVAGIHVTRRIVGQAMAVPPNATIDAQSPPSSNAAKKTPTSSRMYIEIPLVFHLLLPSPIIVAIYMCRSHHRSPATGASLTYLQQIVYQLFPRLMPSAISQTTTTNRQAMHTQISLNSIMLLGVGLSVAE